MPSLEEMAKSVREQRSQILNEGLTSSIPKWMMLGGAAGAGGAGLMGLANLLRRNLTDPPRTLYSPYSPVISDIPYPEEQNHKKKMAAAGPPRSPSAPLPPKMPRRKNAGLLDSITDTAGQIMHGDYATDLASHPLGLATMGASLGAGTVGGYKLMNYLLKRQNKSSRQTELAKARQDYEQALLQQQEHKTAGEKTAGQQLGAELDRLADAWEKVAAEMQKRGFGQGAIGKALGVYLLTGGAIAGLTGNATYDYFRKRQPAAILAKAEKQHRREMATMRPAPIYARPVPVTQTGAPAPSATELGGDVLDEDETGED
jgi:hypothetical protein